jgi:hypothetical protein
MGQSKGGGYSKQETLLPEQLQTLLGQLTQSQASQNQGLQQSQQAAQGFQQFLPGGGGGQALIDQAMKRYQQQTVPSLLSSLGGGSKGSSGLNQALAASASDLNTNLGAQLAQMQLQASQGLGSLGQSQQGLGNQQAGLGVQTPGFAYQQNQMPFYQSAILAALGGGGDLAKSWATGKLT